MKVVAYHFKIELDLSFEKGTNEDKYIRKLKNETFF